jgi:hypothetical protein
MLKLLYSQTRWVNISVYEDENGKCWEIEQDSSGKYVVCEREKEEILKGELDEGDFLLNAPRVGENPQVLRIPPKDDPGNDEVPQEEINRIFGKEAKHG